MIFKYSRKILTRRSLIHRNIKYKKTAILLPNEHVISHTLHEKNINIYRHNHSSFEA